MNTPPTTYRQLKRYLREQLTAEDFSGALFATLALPARKAVNPLISFFCDHDAVLRWRSVSALGAVVARLADKDRESARVVMRRLMWSLNDESGGIGWGAPEAMGEITARHAGLAGEFGHILLSYVREDCNYLEHAVLQRGVLWGADAWPMPGRRWFCRWPGVCFRFSHPKTPTIVAMPPGPCGLWPWPTRPALGRPACRTRAAFSFTRKVFYRIATWRGWPAEI